MREPTRSRVGDRAWRVAPAAPRISLMTLRALPVVAALAVAACSSPAKPNAAPGPTVTVTATATVTASPSADPIPSAAKTDPIGGYICARVRPLWGSDTYLEPAEMYGLGDAAQHAGIPLWAAGAQLATAAAKAREASTAENGAEVRKALTKLGEACLRGGY